MTISPIYTHGGVGCSKPGVNPKLGSAMYEAGSVLRYLANEPALGFPSVRHRAIAETDALDPAARINHSDILAVEHDVKVAFVGDIVGEDWGIIKEAVST